METPDQLRDRLEKMGESRVRGLISTGHFDPRTIPFVKAWLTRSREEERDGGDVVHAERQQDLDEVRAVAADAGQSARNAVESAKSAVESAESIRAAAHNAHRLAFVAVALAGAGLLISILTFLALVLR